MKKYYVGLADEEALLRQGISCMLKNSGNYKVSFEAENTQQAGKQLSKGKTDLLIVALEPAFTAQMQLLAEMKKKKPDLKILVLTRSCTFLEKEELYHQDINGLMLKAGPFERLHHVIQKIKTHGIYFDDSELEKHIQQNKTETELYNLWRKVVLTKREEEILVWVCNEFSNKQIADELHIDEVTVETHRKNINAKLKCGNVGGWVKYAYNIGWIMPLNKDMINIKNLKLPEVPLINDFKCYWGWFY